MHNIQNLCNNYNFDLMLNDRHQFERRNAILRILRVSEVRRQSDLAQLLRRDGFEVTQSSVCRDLRDLGVHKASGRYQAPPDEISRANGDFSALAQFVRAVRPAGASVTVIKTSIGAAASVAVAVDKAEFPEVVGTISGDDTIFIATSDARAQRRLIERLSTLFAS
jgi:transcriptional regulator of arginine metabolism